MRRNLKYIIPLLVVAGTSATSCNNGGSIPHLKRATWEEKTNFKALADEYDEKGEIKTPGLLTQMRNRQFIDPEEEIHTDYNTPEKGKVTTNLNIALSGSIRVLSYYVSKPYNPNVSLDLNNINIAVNDKVTTLWNMNDEECGDYFSCESKSGKSYFIEKSKVKGQDAWYKYYNTPITVDGEETKYKENVASWINEDFHKEFKNFALYQLEGSSGYFQHHKPTSGSTLYSGFGLGITGFGDDMIFEEQKVPYKYPKILNLFMPGAICRIPSPSDYTPNMGEFLDFVAGNEDLTNIIPLKTECTKGNDNKNISMAVDLKRFNFKKSQELVDKIIEETGGLAPEDMVAANGSGTGALDYFSSYKNDWLHQFELTLNLNKVNLQFVYYNHFEYDDDAKIVYINLKNVNAKAYLNETFEPNCGSYNKPSTEGYIDITPEDPA